MGESFLSTSMHICMQTLYLKGILIIDLSCMWCRDRFKGKYPTLLVCAVKKKDSLSKVNATEERLETVRENSPAPTRHGTFTRPFTGTLKSHDWILLATPIGRRMSKYASMHACSLYAILSFRQVRPL